MPCMRKLFVGARHGRTYRKRNIRTFALAICPAFNLSAARDTLVAVRFAVGAAHWAKLPSTLARQTYMMEITVH